MDVNRYLPVLLPALVTLVALGAAGLIALNWTRSAVAHLWIKRALVVLVLITIGGPIIFWFMTWAVEGPPRHTIDRSLQQRQQNELQRRIQQGGH
jgi:glucan phosphoethanolaminetransferase (alkaline phosphatase superfamily)